MHYIQKKILDILRLHDEMHYAELQPEDIESSHFKYHLNQLIKDGNVEKKERGIYGLSDGGKAYVDKLSLNSIKPKNMPKVITYTILRHVNKYLLYKKDKEPYKGLLNNIGGKVHIGETIVEASEREVYEKLGISVESKVLGSLNIQIKNSGRLFTHAIAMVCAASLSEIPENQQIVFINKSELQANNSLAPDLLSVLEIEDTASPKFSEIIIEM